MQHAAGLGVRVEAGERIAVGTTCGRALGFSWAKWKDSDPFVMPYWYKVSRATSLPRHSDPCVMPCWYKVSRATSLPRHSDPYMVP